MRNVRNILLPINGVVSMDRMFDIRLNRSRKSFQQGIIRPFHRDNHLIRLLSGGPIRDMPRLDDYTHVSDLINKCARARAIYLQQGGALTTRALSDSDFVAFAIGNGIHSMIQERAVLRRPNEVYAHWKCNCKSLQYIGIYADAQDMNVCANCGTKPKNYNEIVIHNDRYHIVGSPDLIFMVRDHFYVNEIKSIAKKAWENLTRAKPDHVIQILFYWWLLKEAGYNLFDQVSILYVAKDYIFKSPFKEFVITPSENISRLQTYLQDAAHIKRAKNGGTLPPRNECGDRSAPKARICQFATTCFGVRS